MDDEEEEEEEESDDEEEVVVAPKRPAKKPKAAAALVEVTAEMVRGWQKKLQGGEDTVKLKELVAAFNAAVRFGDSNSAEDEVYTFSSGHVFNLLMQFCLQHMDDILRRHVAGGAAAAAAMRKPKSGVERPDQWMHWRKHQPIVKSYLSNLMTFLGQLAEAAMVAVTLQQVSRLLPFFIALPKLAPKLLKSALKAWSADDTAGGSEQIAVLAFSIVRQLGCTLPYPFIEHCFKGLYLCYAQASKSTSRKALPRIMLRASCYVDLCAVDAHASYRHAFVYIRQLAIHLRNAIQKASPEASRQVYNWQFVNCLRLWAQVLCTHARSPTAPLRQLIYPLVQVTLGTARLLPSIRYAALRLQCARILNQISSELHVFIPVAPLLLEALQFAELSKPAKATKSGRPVDWATMVKASAADCAQRVYQEGLVQETLYLLAEHMHSRCCSIAFPETAAPTVLALRAAAKETKIVALQKRCKRLLVQVEAQAKFVAQKRDLVEFAPSDAAASSEFLKEEYEKASTPFGKWFAGERADAQKAEARRVEEAAAQDEGIVADDDIKDDDSEEESGKSKKAKKKEKQEKQVAKQAADKGAKKVANGKPKKGPKSDGKEMADEVDELRMSDLDSDEE